MWSYVSVKLPNYFTMQLNPLFSFCGSFSLCTLDWLRTHSVGQSDLDLTGVSSVFAYLVLGLHLCASILELFTLSILLEIGWSGPSLEALLLCARVCVCMCVFYMLMNVYVCESAQCPWMSMYLHVRRKGWLWSVFLDYSSPYFGYKFSHWTDHSMSSTSTGQWVSAIIPTSY